MILISGFNQFQQFDHLIREEDLRNKKLENIIAKFAFCDSEAIDDICVSWNSVLTLKDGSVSLSGFLKGGIEKCKTLECPFKGKVVQATGTRKKWIVVTDNGECWEYSAEKCWRSLARMFPAYEEPVELCEEDDDSTTPSICSSDSSSTERDGAIVNESYIKTMVSLDEDDDEFLDESTESPNVKKVSCSTTLVAAVTMEGRLYALPNLLKLPKGCFVIDVSVGIEHGVALTTDGRVLTWGCGSRGQLGLESLDNCENPTEVEALLGLEVVSVSAGGWHTAAVTKDGDLYTWGWNKQGQLGHPCVDSKVWEGRVGVLASPRAVDWSQGLDTTVATVSCGSTHTVVMLKNGEIWGCGWNRWGQLGTDEFSFIDSMTKLNIPEGLKVNKIYCSAWNTVLFCDKPN